MSLNSINKFLTNNLLWIGFSFIAMTLYLSPLFYDVFYVPTFDNLDSNVVWFKILAESGMIFADNNAIIPNMMNGLPRSSYGSEFNVILWLYYFFEAKTAFIINEVIIHLVAFFSMFIFLKKYIVKPNNYYKNVPVFVGALYFALLPFWSGAGLSIAILPLVTYSLLNIKHKDSTKWDWILLIFLPLYTSFIFLYMFYIILAGIYMLWDTIKNKNLNKPFFFALFLMGIVFLLSEYRLLLAMFTDSGFISHRSEFKIFFTDDALSSLRKIHTFFLSGHSSHIPGLQSYYLLPLILIGMILSIGNRRFNQQESMVIWTLIILSFILQIWNPILTNIYTLPILTIFTILIAIRTKQNSIYSLLFLLQILLAFIAGANHYSGLHIIAEYFPIFEKLNITRIAFIQPFLWAILLVFTLNIIIKKLRFSTVFITLFMIFQTITSFYYSFYQTEPSVKYSSFQNYYAKSLFSRISDTIPEPLNSIRVVSYGLEPAVSLYNGFYTIDGYIVNYPLSYKHKFRKVIESYLDRKNNVSAKAKEIYDNWGSKLYILETTVTLDYYNKKRLSKNSSFNTIALCNMNVKYLLSAYEFESPEKKRLILFKYFLGKEDSWDIYLYKLICN